MYTSAIQIVIFLQGPPGSQKKAAMDSLELEEDARRQEETSYELMLKQQQLFLQWQLEMQSKVILARVDVMATIFGYF
jgi:hypothetical protein